MNIFKALCKSNLTCHKLLVICYFFSLLLQKKSNIESEWVFWIMIPGYSLCWWEKSFHQAWKAQWQDQEWLVTWHRSQEGEQGLPVLSLFSAFYAAQSLTQPLGWGCLQLRWSFPPQWPNLNKSPQESLEVLHPR